jgi:hypothetical protein
MDKPSVVRDVGPVLESWFCGPGAWAGINGPTGSRWTFEFLRNGVVVETLTRDGEPDVTWRGYPKGWIEPTATWPEYLPFYAWHRRTADDAGQNIQCRVTVTNGVGQASSITQPMGSDAAGEPVPAPQITAKAASGVLRRGSFKVAYTGKGKLSAKSGKRVIATGTAKSGAATLKLTAVGRKLLKRKRRITVTVTAGGTSTRVTLRA